MTRAITLYDEKGHEIQKTLRRRDIEAMQRLRYEKAITARKRWNTRLKRARTALASLNRTIHYYERVLAKASEKES